MGKFLGFYLSFIFSKYMPKVNHCSDIYAKSQENNCKNDPHLKFVAFGGKCGHFPLPLKTSLILTFTVKILICS